MDRAVDRWISRSKDGWITATLDRWIGESVDSLIAGSMDRWICGSMGLLIERWVGRWIGESNRLSTRIELTLMMGRNDLSLDRNDLDRNGRTADF